MAGEGKLVGFITESDDADAAVLASNMVRESAVLCQAQPRLFWRIEQNDGLVRVLNVYDFGNTEAEMFKRSGRALEGCRNDIVNYRFFDVTREMLVDAAQNVLASWKFVLGSG